MAVSKRTFYIKIDVENNNRNISQDYIKSLLNSENNNKNLDKWAFILHDKDTYTEQDENKNPKHKNGNIRPAQWHIALHYKNQKSIKPIAKLFNIQLEDIYTPTDKNGTSVYTDIIDKKLIGDTYDKKNLVTNFNYNIKLCNNRTNSNKTNNKLTYEQLCKKITYDGLKMSYVRDNYKTLYIEHENKFKKLRADYLCNCKPPSIRTNIYITGKSGTGKGVLSEAIARILFPNFKDDDIYFYVGDDKVPFDGYDGQPVIIWDDNRHYELIKMLGSKSKFLKVFDINPKSIRFNIKYGHIKLINEFNIVNSVESSDEFLNNILEDEESEQAWRRFSIIFDLNYNSFNVKVSKHNLEKYDNPKEFENLTAKPINYSFRRIREKYAQNESVAISYENNLLKSICIPEIIDKIKDNKLDLTYNDIKKKVKNNLNNNIQLYSYINNNITKKVENNLNSLIQLPKFSNDFNELFF